MRDIEIHDDAPIDDPVFERLSQLEQEDNLYTEVVLAEAADPSSPFHSHVNWDDVSAAHQHRLDQVRKLISRYKMVRITTDGERVRYRAISHVQSVGRYHNTDRALQGEWREELLASAKRMMGAYSLRYQQLGKAALLDIALDVLGEQQERPAA